MGNLIRRLLFLLAVIWTLPLILLSWIESALTGGKSEKIYGSCKELLAATPTFFGDYSRSAFYWAVCRDVSTGIMFLYGSMIGHRDVSIKSHVIIGCYSIVGYAEIGEHVIIGSRVSLLSGRYQHGRPGEETEARDDGAEYTRIKVGDNAWIGEGALVMADIGRNATVGAGSVVYKEVPDDTTVLGNPARKVSF